MTKGSRVCFGGDENVLKFIVQRILQKYMNIQKIFELHALNGGQLYCMCILSHNS